MNVGAPSPPLGPPGTRPRRSTAFLGGLAAPGRARPGGPAVGVVGGDPAQSAQHLGHVRAEHPPVAMALVYDHVAQPGQEPGPAGVPGQQREVQRVRRGQQIVRVRPGPAPARRRSVAVQDGSPYPRHAQRPDGAQLVGGQRLGGSEVHHRPALQHGGERGHQVAQRLARGGRGGDDHVPAGPGLLRGRRLVVPGGLDPAAGEPLAEAPAAPSLATAPSGRPGREYAGCGSRTHPGCLHAESAHSRQRRRRARSLDQRQQASAGRPGGLGGDGGSHGHRFSVCHA